MIHLLQPFATMAQLLNWASVTVMLALITAFPPVFFTAITTDEGMRISLGLFVFYTLRGLIAMTSLAKYRSTQGVMFLRTVIIRILKLFVYFYCLESAVAIGRSSPILRSHLVITEIDSFLFPSHSV